MSVREEPSQPAVWIFAHLVGMELALTAAGLCLAWRLLFPRSSRASLAAAGAAVFHLLSFGTLIPLWFELSLEARVLAGALCGLIVLVWTGYFCSGRIGRRAAHGQRRLFAHFPWIYLGLAAQLGSAAVSAWIAGWWFTSRAPYPPVPPQAVSISIAGGLVSGAILLGAAAFGGLSAGTGLHEFRPDHPLTNSRLGRTVRFLELAIILRSLAIAGSLAIGALFNPISPRYFLQRMLYAGSSLIFIRILLGLALPLLFGWLAALSLRERARDEAAAQFFPMLIVVLISEILAAGLTVGMSGLAL